MENSNNSYHKLAMSLATVRQLATCYPEYMNRRELPRTDANDTDPFIALANRQLVQGRASQPESADETMHLYLKMRRREKRRQRIANLGQQALSGIRRGWDQIQAFEPPWRDHE